MNDGTQCMYLRWPFVLVIYDEIRLVIRAYVPRPATSAEYYQGILRSAWAAGRADKVKADRCRDKAAPPHRWRPDEQGHEARPAVP